MTTWAWTPNSIGSVFVGVSILVSAVFLAIVLRKQEPVPKLPSTPPLSPTDGNQRRRSTRETHRELNRLYQASREGQKALIQAGGRNGHISAKQAHILLTATRDQLITRQMNERIHDLLLQFEALAAAANMGYYELETVWRTVGPYLLSTEERARFYIDLVHERRPDRYINFLRLIESLSTFASAEAAHNRNRPSDTSGWERLLEPSGGQLQGIGAQVAS